MHAGVQGQEKFNLAVVKMPGHTFLVTGTGVDRKPTALDGGPPAHKWRSKILDRCHRNLRQGFAILLSLAVFHSLKLNLGRTNGSTRLGLKALCMQTLAFNYAGQHMIAIKQGQVTGWLSLLVHFSTTKMHP